MKTIKLILLVVLILLTNNIYSQFIGEAIDFGMTTKKKIAQNDREKKELKGEISDNSKELINKINTLSNEILYYRDIIRKQANTIQNLQETVNDLKDQLAKGEVKYNNLLVKYLSLIDTLRSKDITIEKLRSVIEMKDYEIKELVKQRDALRKKLGQKSPDWTTAFLNEHKKAKLGYILTITVNTTNMAEYFDQKQSSCPNLKIFAVLSDIVLDNGQLMGSISNIGDGEFKTCDVTLSETNRLQFYFKTPNKLNKYDYIFPIIYFYMECNGISEQLGVIDNIKIPKK